jgi:hypothetical protein
MALVMVWVSVVLLLQAKLMWEAKTQVFQSQEGSVMQLGVQVLI